MHKGGVALSRLPPSSRQAMARLDHAGKKKKYMAKIPEVEPQLQT
jgi:hypothetical protein